MSLVAGGAAALMLVAGESPAGAATGAHSHKRPTLTVHTTHKHHVLAPAETPPGFAHLRVTGHDPVAVFKGKNHATIDDLIKVLKGSGKNYRKHFAVVAELTPRRDTYLRLRRGHYFFLDVYTERVKAANITETHVLGATKNAKLPKSQRLTVDKHNHLHGPISAPRRGWLHVRNFDGNPQGLMILKVGSRTSDEKLAKFFADPSDDALFDLDIRSLDSLGLLPGHQSSFYHLGGPGRFIVLTTALTDKGSDSIVVKGRLRELVVR